MKIKQKNKKGISLIVLVITIIVMIILAAAIILSLNSSGIIGKANKATTESDAANKKEAAAIKLAEYELAKQMGELEDPTQTANEYVKEELEKDGIDTSDMAISEDGEILTDLTELAVNFIDAGVKIGDVVEGYTLDTSDEAKTYTTSGNENTADPNDCYAETDPQPASITRDESITWKYFGIDEKGEVTIVGSITSTSTKMILGGRGGYLNGPTELKEACEAMYSSDMGTARSITIEDVTRVLEYTGERGSYSAKSGGYTPTKEPLTIGQIISEKGEPTLSSTETPDGKDINTYESNYYYINKTSDAKEYNTAMADLIYPESTNTTLTATYWLASPCVGTDFTNGYAWFDVSFVLDSNVQGCFMLDSEGHYEFGEYAIRPVVSLSSDITMSYSNGVVALSE